jgi:ADP-heptose:LPS heptosyltransferase
LPQWVGHTPVPGDSLLLFVEQGWGDMLHFSRYLPLAAERFSGRVSIVVGRPLLSLFRRSFPMIEVLDIHPTDQSSWQWQCPLLSLPLAFGTIIETIPNNIPYLSPDPIRVSRWKNKISELGFPLTTRKIGIVWKPGAAMKSAHLKAIALQEMSQLLNRSNYAWFSLQKDPDPASNPWIASGKLIDWAAEFSDFDETAALAVNMDLIISVDTAVAHLAGALGLPTWLINRYASDWRWMRNREYSPWYPTVRIFTQKTSGCWNYVVGRIEAALAEIPQSKIGE